MRLDLRKLRFRQPKLVATHLCLLFGSRESRHYVRANTFMGPDPKTATALLAAPNPQRGESASQIAGLNPSTLFKRLSKEHICRWERVMAGNRSESKEGSDERRTFLG